MDPTTLPPIELNPVKPPAVKGMMDMLLPEPPKEEVKVEIPPVKIEEPKKVEEPKKGGLLDDFSLSDEPKVEIPVKVEEPKKGKEFNFRELTKKREEAEARAKKLEEDLKAREERLKELETILEKTNFEQSPKFKQTYLQPVSEAEQAVVDFVKDMGEDESVARHILSLTGRERIEYLDTAFGSSAATAEILRLANAHTVKHNELRGALDNHKETQAKLQLAAQVDEQKQQENLEENFSFVLNKLVPKVSLLREVDGDVEHNKMVQERVATAKAIMLGTAKEEDILIAPFLAVTCKEYIRRNAELQEELDRYKSEAALRAEGDAGPRRGPVAPVKQTGKPRGAMSVLDEMGIR